MNDRIQLLLRQARQALTQGNWSAATLACQNLVDLAPTFVEGHFITGLVFGSMGRTLLASKAFSRAYTLDATRVDAAVQLARCKVMLGDYANAEQFVDGVVDTLADQAPLLDLAATVYSRIGKQEKAWPLYVRANKFNVNNTTLQCNLASCAVFLGKNDIARETLRSVLHRQPHHYKAHWLLSKIETALDTTHINAMIKVLKNTPTTSTPVSFVHYALGKEHEDLQQWRTAWQHYQAGADLTRTAISYDSSNDTELVDTIISGCHQQWLSSAVRDAPSVEKKPIFIIGLPRSGTTLVERIISSHSAVESAGELKFLALAVKNASAVSGEELVSAAIIKGALTKPIDAIAREYLQASSYLFDSAPYFIDKLPYNFFYLGFIARAFPGAKIVHLRRHPMDACLAMYKQLFAGAYNFSYELEELADFYINYQRLMDHWRSCLGSRLIEVSYDDLVVDQDKQTRTLLKKIGLPFEQNCLNFHNNQNAVATASASQVREKIHTRSLGKWRHFATELEPLRRKLLAAGVSMD